jgi:glycosyltransferase involved in cell wall biosynthesis/peptidoglycan/xylan/chitin deacetylase (PgdA/CDA1 family)
LKFSVVIPTYNRETVLRRTLPSIFEQDFPADAYEVVIVVDGSTDGTSEFLRSAKPGCGLRIVEQANSGQTVALNVGGKSARGEFILFLDDDIICCPTLLQEHAAAHSAHNQATDCVVIGPVWIAPESPESLASDWYRAWSNDYFNKLSSETILKDPGLVYVAANTSLPRVVFLRNGGFDEQLRHREDIELGLRLWTKGTGFRYASGATTHQLYVRSAKDLVRRDAVVNGSNEVLICRRYPVHRAQSVLAKIGDPLLKRFLRELAIRSPICPSSVLQVPTRVAYRFRSIPSMRKAAVRLHQKAYSSIFARSALEQVGSWKALKREFGVQLPVLLYHHVGPPRPEIAPWLSLSPESFERQVRWLSRRGYVGIRPADWLKWCREGTGLPQKPVLLTFDDGYADTADYALPILEQCGFGSAVFVVTGSIGRTNTWDKPRNNGSAKIMTEKQIQHWATRGVEFGSHSKTHRDLTTLNQAELQDEIFGSGNDLAQVLGGRVISFAYPYGSHNEAVDDCVRGIFDVSFTTEAGLNNLSTDLHLLRRPVSGITTSITDLRCRVQVGWSPFYELRTRIPVNLRVKRAARAILGMNAR